MFSEVTWSIKDNPSVLSYSLSSNVKRQTPDLRGRAEITKQSVSSGKKWNFLQVMVLGKKAKCLTKQYRSSWPTRSKGRREPQFGSWHLQAAKLVGFPSPCLSPCSLPTCTHSCSLPGWPWCQPMSKNFRNAAPQCCGQGWGRHRNMCCLQKIALNIPWHNREQKCGTTKGIGRVFLPFPWATGKVEGYL